MLEKRSGARVLDHDDSFKPQKKNQRFSARFYHDLQFLYVEIKICLICKICERIKNKAFAKC